MDYSDWLLAKFLAVIVLAFLYGLWKGLSGH